MGGVVVLVAVGLAGCSDRTSGSGDADALLALATARTAEPGSPLPGLSAEDRARFQAGRALFDRDFTPEEGLGPLFNQARCSSCHDVPTSGGTGVELIRKASRWDPAQGCDLLRHEGGDNLQQRVTPALAAHGIRFEATPQSATDVIDMVAPVLYGLGLLERVPESELIRRADPEDQDGDGISGRIVELPGGRSGRFGQKADHPDLRAFVVGALAAEMGLTSPDRPQEELPNGQALPEGVDPAAEPEVGTSQVDALTDYLRLLAPAPRAVPEDPAVRRTAQRGEAVFDEIGCTGCHVPALPTSDSGAVAAYTDLLVHDLGEAVADLCSLQTSPSEFRTAPLMGLRFRNELLHNGKARRLEDAIELHGGEAARARARFLGLAPGAREALLVFLRTL